LSNFHCMLEVIILCKVVLYHVFHYQRAWHVRSLQEQKFQFLEFFPKLRQNWRSNILENTWEPKQNKKEKPTVFVHTIFCSSSKSLTLGVLGLITAGNKPSISDNPILPSHSWCTIHKIDCSKIFLFYNSPFYLISRIKENLSNSAVHWSQGIICVVQKFPCCIHLTKKLSLT